MPPCPGGRPFQVGKSAMSLKLMPLAVFAAALFTTAASAQSDPWVAYATGNGDTYLAAFDENIGLRTGPGACPNVGDNIAFEHFGGVTFAPDGTAWIAYATGNGDTYLAAFDGSTGYRTGPGAYLSVGENIAFEHFGGVAFAPDGTAWVAYATGNGDTYLAAFDGSVTFAPDGAAWVAYATGNGDTYLAAFDANTGYRTGPGAYLSVGENIAFEHFGGVTFAPDGAAWVAYATGNGDTYLAAFDANTGYRTGPGAYLNVGENIAFEQFGGVAFAPNPQPGGPVPEPASWAMMILGLGTVGARMRRRHGLAIRFA
ncbi:MAG: PEP-CTERM sorting domain-containing protein [Sphingomonadales bacterium]|nr:PEP-CTERM sorting domain-containing protein [Sphingomonadales bacterium]